jgi:hypothetical protein
MLKGSVEKAIEELRMAFAPSMLTIVEDEQGGAHVIVERTDLGPPYLQTETWIGGHLTPFFPNSDIYPLFVRGDLARADGNPLVAPVTSGHVYQARAAVQVSRRSNARDPQRETATMKYMKVASYLLSL